MKASDLDQDAAVGPQDDFRSEARPLLRRRPARLPQLLQVPQDVPVGGEGLGPTLRDAVRGAALWTREDAVVDESA